MLAAGRTLPDVYVLLSDRADSKRCTRTANCSSTNAEHEPCVCSRHLVKRHQYAPPSFEGAMTYTAGGVQRRNGVSFSYAPGDGWAISSMTVPHGVFA